MCSSERRGKNYSLQSRVRTVTSETRPERLLKGRNRTLVSGPKKDGNLKEHRVRPQRDEGGRALAWELRVVASRDGALIPGEIL